MRVSGSGHGGEGHDLAAGIGMRLGSVIRAYRMHREISLRKCAKEIGIGAATLMRAEQHYALDAKTFLAILRWLTEDAT